MISKEKIVSLMDLTQLGDNDTDADIIKLCEKARNLLGEVAAICVYKQFVPLVKKQLGKDFEVATVINFPAGKSSLEDVLAETQDALSLGADEIDLVIDYKGYIANGNSEYSCNLVSQVKKLCANKTLKVIIETGELKDDTLIKKVATDAIVNGADFVKTSTGKTPVGATPEAAKTILETICVINPKVGFKASGGIRDYKQAIQYMQLADTIIDNSYINPNKFRFGVSGLLDNLLNSTEEDINGY
ncbi:deoxyribose-phosphate aldolase [Francisellaceae bacterium CB299]|jgi:deoxyribose-phosphate aldolase